VLIVTATNEFVTRPIAQALGVEELLAVQLARDAQRLVHRRNRRHAHHARRQGAAHGTMAGRARAGWGDVESTFYSDSMNDVPLLEKVDHPVATNPDARLRALAQERGWRILDLFSTAQCQQPAKAPAPEMPSPVYCIPMIKKFIDKLLGKSTPGTSGGKPHFGKREEVPCLGARHQPRAGGPPRRRRGAHAQGGGLRGLHRGRRRARPAAGPAPQGLRRGHQRHARAGQGLFRRAFIIGKRFRIVHVVHGRGREHEVIEVSTFRAYLDNAAAGR
jgi:hypothetical protein